MEVQEVKEQLKSIFRTVINNDKWITIHPHGEDSDDYRRIKLEDGETPKEAIDRTYGKDEKSDTKDEQSDSTGDLDIDELVNVTEDYYNRISEDELKKEFKDIQKEFAKWKDKKNFPEYKDYKNKLLKIKDIYEKRFGKQSDTKDDGEYSEDFKKLADETVELERNYLENPSSELAKQINKNRNKLLSNKKYAKLVYDKNIAKPDIQDGSKDISKEEYAKIKEQVSKMSDDELVKAHFESQKGYESETPRAGSMTKHEATYGEVAQELKRRTGRSFSTASTESEIKEALLKAKSDSKGEEKKDSDSIDEKIKKYEEKIPKNYRRDDKTKALWLYKNSYITRSEWEKVRANNSKEQDMALLEEIKKLITRVENNKENEMEIENAKVDKRDIIRQIMAIAGKEEASEDVKTIAKLAEKLAYDKSEAGTADNEMDKEDPDDEKEVKEVKEEVKEDVENKCKNSVDNSKTDYFAEMNKIYNAAQEAKKENIYISQAQREQDAVDYFKK